MIIRFFDILFSLLGLIVLSPLLFVISLLIVIDSKGGIFYFQNRVGKNSVEFRLYKFRTMEVNSDKNGSLTIGTRDIRISRIGYYLRKYKLDELPQLINVLIGDMNLVGPRPELRKYVDLYNEKQKSILNVKPGITDYASIEYFNENEILANSLNPEKTYIEDIMPKKIELNMKYIYNKNVKIYFSIIINTIFQIVKGNSSSK